MPLPRPRHLPLIIVASLLAVGCGDGDVDDERDAPRAVTVPDAVAQQQQREDDDDGEDVEVVPTPAAIGQGARLDALLAAYATVSERVNYLVTAETLRRDAVESGAGEDVELERTGSVRVEVNRMRNVLRAARPKVAAVPLTSNVQRRVQRHMLDAIDARLRSLGQLDAALDGLASELPDRVAEQRFEAWRTSWDESLRAARTATTVLQGARAALGLAPAPEEAIR